MMVILILLILLLCLLLSLLLLLLFYYVDLHSLPLNVYRHVYIPSVYCIITHSNSFFLYSSIDHRHIHYILDMDVAINPENDVFSQYDLILGMLYICGAQGNKGQKHIYEHFKSYQSRLKSSLNHRKMSHKTPTPVVDVEMNSHTSPGEVDGEVGVYDLSTWDAYTAFYPAVESANIRYVTHGSDLYMCDMYTVFLLLYSNECVQICCIESRLVVYCSLVVILIHSPSHYRSSRSRR